MIIKKKRIRSLKFLETLVKRGDRIVIGVSDIERFREALLMIGFSETLEVGQTILPAATFGPVSSFNAEGKYIKHKDQPMETAYRQIEWHWTEFHGPYDRVEQSDIRDVPYQRYPRTFVEPPGVEMTIQSTSSKYSIITGPKIEFASGNDRVVAHMINLFLEIFGECQFFTEKLDTLFKAPIKRLNWRILPPGQHPWPYLRKEIDEVLKDVPDGNRPVIEYRMETINAFEPDFAAIGEGGFRGYVVLGFKKTGVFVCESLLYGNATYVFDKAWEELTKKTKGEILSDNLQSDRIIHIKGWDDKVHRLLT